MKFLRETRIQASPAAVFAFHESPGAFLRLTPPWEKVKIVEGGTSIREGSRVVIETKIGLVPLRCVALHTEYAPPHLFADRQESGPFASWYHRHHFLDDGAGGTILRDEIDYEPPLGWIGKLLGDGLIEQKLDRMFAYRHNETKRIVESGDYPGAEEFVS